MAAFPSPTGGASLLLSFRLPSKTVLIVGSNPLAASRAFSALEADSSVTVIAKGGANTACEELRWRGVEGQVNILDLDLLPCSSSSASDEDHDVEALDAYISASDGISLVCVTDTLTGTNTAVRRTRPSALQIARICRARNIPVNITDMPDLCDFTFTSTHRVHDADSGAATSLQIGVTTNGQGCRLASRLRRDIVAKLPKEVGGAVMKMGRLRALAKVSSGAIEYAEQELSEEGIATTPNEPVPQRAANETDIERVRRRMKWVAQVSEYWPIQKLSKMSEDEMASVLDGSGGLTSTSSSGLKAPESGLQDHPGTARIFLVGSGPGHPSLLTLATYAALTKHANLVLSDKLVPAAVLALIPPEVDVRIARKFPGNADSAQAELMEAAVDAARRGLTVVRLKQGDPTVYGRAGEEVLYFRTHGFEPVVVPGVSSVLAGPTFAGIPVTQRGAAESFIVCTGVGRQGKEVKLPGYERGRTLVILMGVARLPQVLETLQRELPGTNNGSASRRDGPAYPSCTPIALIERASMPTNASFALHYATSQLGSKVSANNVRRGCSWSGAPDKDEERVRTWLDGKLWRVNEGLDAEWEEWRFVLVENRAQELFQRCLPRHELSKGSKTHDIDNLHFVPGWCWDLRIFSILCIILSANLVPSLLDGIAMPFPFLDI
ncbi:putative uroporphyrinogen-III C-methyltransferase [Grifola frondosa]|uniref:precorrin-2 dehydrogenase n=1 Tax=Grifola frondosa TaxID=5627 RepID=A0A1C7MR60_GRIFR|nr:putative uroporphyrinogen-III C-methyltransferase [Grifola frondosa]